MRSAAYSLFTSLLLLVPIAAVPLMAIFGVPQFTSVVASPLDELEDEDDWNKPPRKKSKAQVPNRNHADDAELTAEEAWNWDDSPVQRRSPAKSPRAAGRLSQSANEKKSPGSSIAERGKKSKLPAAGKKRVVIPADVFDDEPAIQNVSFEASEEDRPFVQTADDSEETEVDAALIPSGGDPPEIPGYRRLRPGDDADRLGDKNSKFKRIAPPAEPLTWKKAVDRLNELGIRNFRLEPGIRPGEFTFTCSYTPSQTPHVTRKFEADADDPLKAVGQVLAQVEKWSQQKNAEAPRRLTENVERRSVD